MSRSTTSAPARSWSWIASASTLLVLLLVFLNGNPIGNNFDTGRYYTVMMVVPAMVTTLACIVVQRFINPRIMLVALAAYEVIVITWYSAIALDFQAWNGDALPYISSYMFIYHGGLYAAMLAGALPLAYLAFMESLPALKQRHARGELVLANVLHDSAWIVAITIASLLLAKLFALGTSHLALAAGIGIGIIKDFLSPSQAMAIQPDAALSEGPRVQSSSRLKNTFLIIIIAVAAMGLAYLWSISYMRLGDGFVAIYAVDPHQVLDDTLLGLAIFEPIAIVLLVVASLRKARDLPVVYEELVYALSFVGLLAIEWLLVIAGTRVLPARAPLLLTPIGIVFGESWLATVLVTRRRDSGGLFGTAWLLGGVTSWIGLCVSTSPDLDGIVYIISGVIGLVVVLSILIVTVVNQLFVAGKPDRAVPIKHAIEWPSGSHPRLVMVRRHVRTIGIVAIVALVAVPFAFTATAAASPARYQLLANVNNDCIFYLADPMTRIAPEYQPYFGLHGLASSNPSIAISAAKGEYEPVQVVMKPINQDHFTVYSITFSDLVLETSPSVKIIASNWSAYTVEAVAPLSNIVQDMVVPFTKYTVSDGLNHPLWLVVRVPRAAMAGDYRGSILMEVDNKTENPLDWNPGKLLTVSFPVELHVFNFTLPDSPTLKSNFGFSTSDPDFSTVTGWFQDHRMMHWSHIEFPTATINSTGNVTAIDTATLDAEMNAIHAYGTRTVGLYASKLWGGSFLPAGSFVVNSTSYTATTYMASPYWNATARQYVAMLESYLQSKTYLDWFGANISWHDEIYLTGYDEVDAQGMAKIANAIRVYTWIKATANATLPIMQTMGHNAALEAIVDIICFHTGGYEQDGIQAFRAASPAHDVWIYTTCGPRFPHPTIATYGMATQPRSLAWQCFLYNYSQYLIWDVATTWNAGNGYAYQGWNGGSLLYSVPGGYALSTRMEMIREGFEDYEYFTLLARAPASPARDALLSRVSGLMDGFVPTMDYRSWQALRVDIGAFLSS